MGKDHQIEGGEEGQGRRYLEGENSMSTEWLFRKNSRKFYVMIQKMQGREGRGMSRDEQILRF